ncbi:MAG: cytochrome c maturation protein CcmE, partial [Coriobacteriia bacterium]|nr:cytochrome c maturation protein CcmE [Coriobacteriia bacterium]
AAVASITVFIVLFSGAKGRTVAEVVDNPDLIGERIKVSGTVVPGSWDKKTSPMRFEIREEGSDGGPTIKVVYSGGMPSTFGDGVVAVVTGTLSDGPVLESNDMITKCPSKYETAEDALTVASLMSAKESMTGVTSKVSGEIVPGSVQPPGGSVRFVLSSEGSQTLEVGYDGGIPDGLGDGSSVVIQGALESDGVFAATAVSLAEETQ